MATVGSKVATRLPSTRLKMTKMATRMQNGDTSDRCDTYDRFGAGAAGRAGGEGIRRNDGKRLLSVGAAVASYLWRAKEARAEAVEMTLSAAFRSSFGKVLPQAVHVVWLRTSFTAVSFGASTGNWLGVLPSARMRLTKISVQTCLETGACVMGGDAVYLGSQSAALAPVVEEAQAAVHQADVVNMDETGWRQEQQRACLWTVVTVTLTVFRIDRSRGGRGGSAPGVRLCGGRGVAVLAARALNTL